MQEGDLRRILSALRISPGRATSSGWMHTSCPLAPWTHAKGTDRSASFAIKIENGGISAYKCMACRHHGRISSLARKLGHFREEDYDQIAREADHVEMSEAEVPDFEDMHSHDDTPMPLDEDLFEGAFDQIKEHPDAVAYLKRRQVGKRAVERCGLEFDPEARRIIFPVRGIEGELYGWTGRSILPNPKIKVKDYQGLPKRHLVMGQENWERGKPVLVVEGLFAYARLMQMGADEFVNVGAILGSHMTDEKAQRLKDFGEPVILLLDPDKAGDEGTFGILNEDTGDRQAETGAVHKLSSDVPVMVPAYPDGIDDVDDLNREQVIHMIKTTPVYIPD